MNLPSETMWNPIQITIRLATMPIRRSSISRLANKRRKVLMAGRSLAPGFASGAVVIAIDNSPNGCLAVCLTQPFRSGKGWVGLEMQVSRGSVAGSDLAGRDTLADFFLLDPARV